MFFKKKTETKGAVANGAAKAAPTAGPQPAVEIPPAAPAPVTAKVEPAPAAAPASAAPAGPNALRNGDFSNWPSGDKFLAISHHQPIADGWAVGYGDGGVKTVNISRGAPPPGQGGSALVIEVTEPGDGSGWFVLHQAIPDARTLAGREVIVSFWARSTASTPLGVGLIQIFGPGRDRVDAWGGSGPITGDWRQYSIPVTIAPVQDLEAPQDTSLNLNITLPKGAVCKLDLAAVRLAAAT